MANTVFVAPSLLAADPLRFKEELENVEACGADFHHVDVMDGHFVPNLTYGLPLVKAIKANSSIPLDVHIMVSKQVSNYKVAIRGGRVSKMSAYSIP